MHLHDKCKEHISVESFLKHTSYGNMLEKKYQLRLGTNWLNYSKCALNVEPFRPLRCKISGAGCDALRQQKAEIDDHAILSKLRIIRSRKAVLSK